jgi:surface polysaccharide O-acyltransferase-like enzyme
MDVKVSAQAESAVTAVKPQRRHELDLLRGLVVLALIPYHTATYFVTGGWAPWRYQPSPVVTIVVAFATLVAMPLMFLIAGMGVSYSLRKRKAGVFVGERVLRLVVPLVVATLLLLPLIAYYDLSRSPLFEETLAQFYPSFFDVELKLVFPPNLTGPRYAAHHLWFLKDLFVYTLVLLPLFLWLRSRSGQRFVGRLAAICGRPWVIFLFALPIAGIEAALGTEGGWNRFSYPIFLLYGYLLVADPRFGQALRRGWKAGLLAGLLLFCTVGIAGIYHFTTAGIDFQTDPGLLSVLFRLLKGIVAWFLLVGIVGMGQGVRRSQADEGSEDQVREAPESGGRPSLVERAARYLSEAVLPIYILHLTFIVVIGFYVVQWTNNMWARFLVINVVSLVGTLAAYDIVRRTPLTRFLLGMRLRRVAPQPEDAERRSAGGWAKANLPHFGLWAAAVLLTLGLILVANAAGGSLVGRWEQTYDTAQAATGYVAEFREDGTWTAGGGGESIDGTYELLGDGQIWIAYADGTVSTAEYRITTDRFSLISAEGGRQQVFRRLR